MTIKRHRTFKLPFIDKEIELTKTLKPGYKERVVLADENLSQGSGPAVFHTAYELEVLSDDEIRLHPRRNSFITTTKSYRPKNEPPLDLTEEGVNGFLGPDFNYYSSGMERVSTNWSILRPYGKPVRFEWEPTLPNKER